MFCLRSIVKKPKLDTDVALGSRRDWEGSFLPSPEQKETIAVVHCQNGLLDLYSTEHHLILVHDQAAQVLPLCKYNCP